jgi:hypothetical protein
LDLYGEGSRLYRDCVSGGVFARCSWLLNAFSPRVFGLGRAPLPRGRVRVVDI